MSAELRAKDVADDAGQKLKPRRVTLDVWAVLLAFVLALLVRVGVLQQVGW